MQRSFKKCILLSERSQSDKGQGYILYDSNSNTFCKKANSRDTERSAVARDLGEKMKRHSKLLGDFLGCEGDTIVMDAYCYTFM